MLSLAVCTDVERPPLRMITNGDIIIDIRRIMQMQLGHAPF